MHKCIKIKFKMAGVDQDINNKVNIKLNKKSLNNSKNGENTDDLSFTIFDMCCIIFSMGTFVADLTTDIILVTEYWWHGHMYWAGSTLALFLIPSSIAQMFSMRWHILDEAATGIHWLAHCCLLGIAHRYMIVFRTGFQARRSHCLFDFQRLHQQQSDICMLHLFNSFLEDAPQLVLQLYIIATADRWQAFTGISAAASLCSLGWSLAAYTRAMRRARPDKVRAHWSGLILLAAWRGGLIAARVAALVLCAVAFHKWVLVVLCVHWMIMTSWIIRQNTDFCPSLMEERFYNCVVGVIYCFCFFNLREGHSRYRMLAFYALMVPENICCLVLYVLYGNTLRTEIVITASVLIIAGTVVGLSSMCLYYGFFHPAGRITWKKHLSPASVVTQITDNNGRNTLKTLRRPWLERDVVATATSLENVPQDVDYADKKLLLDNWIARSGSPTFASVPILDISDTKDIEFHTVVNTPEKSHNSGNPSEGVVNGSFRSDEKTTAESLSNKLKRRGICSPIELGLKLNELQDDEMFTETSEPINLFTQKRRGICSSTQLEQYDEIIEEPERTVDDQDKPNHDEKVTFKKRRPVCTATELNNIELELSRENVAAIIINSKDTSDEFKNADLESLRYLETITSTSRRTSVLSAHDYENICAVNIAREVWGLRSWKGYSDIETWLHDDSIVREYRDHVASTITSASSEVSSSELDNCSPTFVIGKPLKLRSNNDDYADTLIYDIVSSENSKRFRIADYSNEESNVFIAKPYVVDQNGGLYPLITPLEPIKEELEENENDNISSLVATIDVIRKSTAADSPRNVYRRTEHALDSPVTKESCKANKDRDNTPNVLPKALWYNVVQNDTPFVESESLKSLKKDQDLRVRVYENTDNIERLKQRLDERKATRMENEPRATTRMDNSNFVISSSLQSLVSSPSTEDILSIAEVTQSIPSLTRKSSSRPRRKFSLIRERFELKERRGPMLLETSVSKPVCDNITSTIREKSDIKTLSVDIENIIPVKCDIFKQVDDSITSGKDDSYLYRCSFTNIKEKRSKFLSQVLSPQIGSKK